MTHEADKYQSGPPEDPSHVVRRDPEIVVSPDTRRAERIPPGQSRTRKWPVLHYAHVPEVPTARWKLEVCGLVEKPLTFTWDEFQALPRVRVFSDFHCVTRWSRLGNVWEGVAVRELIARACVSPRAQFVVAHAYDSGWTTNLPFADLDGEDVLLATHHDGAPLSAEHGGPCRLIVPRLYAWKSAKWIRALEFVASDRPGYWEQCGYHLRGDPWTEQRFRDDG
jgi:DMSO/TMAO reductase YedYZ molybdopterin-dependent catalytic subunit